MCPLRVDLLTCIFAPQLAQYTSPLQRYLNVSFRNANNSDVCFIYVHLQNEQLPTSFPVCLSAPSAHIAAAGIGPIRDQFASAVIRRGIKDLVLGLCFTGLFCRNHANMARDSLFLTFCDIMIMDWYMVLKGCMQRLIEQQAPRHKGEAV